MRRMPRCWPASDPGVKGHVPRPNRKAAAQVTSGTAPPYTHHQDGNPVVYGVYATTCTGCLRCAWGHAGVASRQQSRAATERRHEHEPPCFQTGCSPHRLAPALQVAVSCLTRLQQCNKHRAGLSFSPSPTCVYILHLSSGPPWLSSCTSQCQFCEGTATSYPISR